MLLNKFSFEEKNFLSISDINRGIFYSRRVSIQENIVNDFLLEKIYSNDEIF